MSRFGQRLMCVAWPAFLGACALEALVFAMVDPHELHWLGHPVGWSRQGLYSAAFFTFWGVQVVTGWIALVLSEGGPVRGDAA
jgi:hypothetical protein